MPNQTRSVLSPKPKAGSGGKAVLEAAPVAATASKLAPERRAVAPAKPDKGTAVQKAIIEKPAAAKSAPTMTSNAIKSTSVVPMDYETFLSKLGPRDRLNVERHITACEAEPDTAHCALWKRIAIHIMSLAPHAPKTAGQQAVQFFIPDGKYRMQVYALHDQSDLKLSVYVSTTLDDIFKAGILTKSPPQNGSSYPIAAAPGQLLTVEELDGKSADPSPFYKDMLGWNRKAVRLTLVTTATTEQATAAEAICTLAGKKWAQ